QFSIRLQMGEMDPVDVTTCGIFFIGDFLDPLYSYSNPSDYYFFSFFPSTPEEEIEAVLGKLAWLDEVAGTITYGPHESFLSSMGMLGIDAAQTCSNIITLATQLILDYYYLMDEEPIDPFPGGGGPGGGTGSNPPGGNDPIVKQAVLNTARPSPCDAVELAVSLAGNAAIQQVIDSIKNKPVEWGAVIKPLSPENVDSIYMSAIYTNNDTNSITTTSYWNNLQGYHIGFIHNHP